MRRKLLFRDMANGVQLAGECAASCLSAHTSREVCVSLWTILLGLSPEMKV